jgi:uncharacterized protein (DUF433 family)
VRPAEVQTLGQHHRVCSLFAGIRNHAASPLKVRVRSAPFDEHLAQGNAHQDKVSRKNVSRLSGKRGADHPGHLSLPKRPWEIAIVIGVSSMYDVVMQWSDRIVIDPEVLAGKPIIRGSRLSVEFVLELLAAGRTERELIEDYPGLKREDILACLSYARYLAHEFRAYPIPA